MKIGVWCTIRSERIIGPIFFQNTVDSRTYVNDILTPFFMELTDREHDFAFFQQDSATAYTADNSTYKIGRVFHDRIISRDLWPADSPDMTPCDFYFSDGLNNAVYKTKPRTLEGLKLNIRY